MKTFFLSCNEEGITYLENEENGSSFFVENGILNVKKSDVLDSLLLANSLKTEKEIRNWEDSIGFKSYNIKYNELYSEYERITNKLSEYNKNDVILELENFRSQNADYILLGSGKLDEGALDYTISPRINSPFSNFLASNGKIIIEGREVDFTIGTRATDFENKTITKSSSASKRRMTVRVQYNYFGYNNTPYFVPQIYVAHSKKTMGMWFNYNTMYYMQFDAWQGDHYSYGETKTGYIPFPSGYSVTQYIRIWNRGVGESNAVTFKF